MKRKIISVQSQVANGYVGNNISALAIQLHGFDPIQIPTVLLSNHVEYPAFYGQSLTPELFSELLKGIKANHFIEESNFLISGFCNEKAILSALASFIRETKQSVDYQYIYDPAFGDFRSGGCYFPKDIADHSVKKLLPLCQILTPNHFELEYIFGKKVNSEQQFLDAVSEHPVLPSKTIIGTSIHFTDTPVDFTEVVLFRNGRLQRFRTPLIPIEVIGTGDLFSALIACQLNLEKGVQESVSKAIEFMQLGLIELQKQNQVEFNAATMLKCAGQLL